MKHEKKRNVLFVMMILCALLIVAALYTNFAYEKVEALKKLDVKLVSIRAEDFTINRFTLVIDLDIYNPNEKEVSVGNFTARAYSNNVLLATVDLPSFKMPAMRSYPTEYQLGINYLDVGFTLLQALKEKKVTWEVNGTYFIQLPLGLAYPYSF